MNGSGVGDGWVRQGGEGEGKGREGDDVFVV